MNDDETAPREEAKVEWVFDNDCRLSVNYPQSLHLDHLDTRDKAEIRESFRELRMRIAALPSDADERIVEAARRQLELYASLYIDSLTEAPEVEIEAAVGPPESLVPPVPPRVGEALVGLFCRREMREAVLGDLDEKFAELVERRGARVAKAWYWSQAARSALFFAVRWGRRLLELEAILKRIL